MVGSPILHFCSHLQGTPVIPTLPHIQEPHSGTHCLVKVETLVTAHSFIPKNVCLLVQERYCAYSGQSEVKNDILMSRSKSKANPQIHKTVTRWYFPACDWTCNGILTQPTSHLNISFSFPGCDWNYRLSWWDKLRPSVNPGFCLWQGLMRPRKLVFLMSHVEIKLSWFPLATYYALESMHSSTRVCSSKFWACVLQCNWVLLSI
jgi:hypothetical protein